MKIQYIAAPFKREERETVINCSYNDEGGYEWTAESSIPSHIAKLRKAGWEATGEIRASSNETTQSATFKTTAKKPITFRNIEKILNGSKAGKQK